jgi:hypothetical protein
MRLFTLISLWFLWLAPAAAHALHTPHAHALIDFEHVAAVLMMAGFVGFAIRKVKRRGVAKSKPAVD